MRAAALFLLVASVSAAGSFLRAFHASPDAPAVDVLANDAKVVSSLTYPHASTFARVDPGRYDIKIVPAGGTRVLLQTNVFVPPDTAITAVVRGYAASLGFDYFASLDFAPPNGCSVRIAHLSPDAPAVDILLNGERSLRHVRFPEFVPPIGHIFLRPATYNVSVNVADSNTTVLSTSYVCAAGVEQTVAVVGTLSGGPSLEFDVLTDNVPTVRVA